jgi:Raf kinase inhibitor-like YbhB/YbcL family protein
MTPHTLSPEQEKAATYKKIEITSSAFKENGFIPKTYTCDGKNVNPSLNIGRVPDTTKSLAIIVDDPDAPGGCWVHWVTWNIPVTDRLGENEVPGAQGMNDYSKHVYDGPCPPKGTHHYHFKVYALDCKLEIPVSSNKNDLEKAMNGHILGFGELVGVYNRK